MSWIKGSRCGSGGCVEVQWTAEGGVQVRDSKDPNSPILTFNTDEWAVFRAGVKAGEFDQPPT